MKSTRYCGDVTIDLENLGESGGRLQFGGRVNVGHCSWEFDHIRVKPSEDIEANFDRAAEYAVHAGSLYNMQWAHFVDLPDWAPPIVIAQRVNDGLSCDERGYCIQRKVGGPVMPLV